MRWWLCSLAMASVAGAELASPVVPAGELPAWDLARDAQRLAREFVRNDLTAAADPAEGAVLDWAFVLREGGFADIFCRRTIEAPFERLRLRVRNLGQPLQLAVKLADADGAEWTVKPIDLAGGGEWQTVDWPMVDWQVASWSRDANNALDFPVRYLAVIAFGVSPGPEYRLQVGRVEAIRPTPVPARVRAELPRALAAGSRVQGSVEVTPLGPLPNDAYTGRMPRLVLARDHVPVTELALTWDRDPAAWEAGVPVTAAVDLSLSAWLPGGELTWRLALPGVRADHDPTPGETIALGPVTLAARQPGELTAEVRRHHGAPTIFINGEPHNGMAKAAYGPSSEVFRQFGEAGVRLFSIMGTPTSHGYTLAADCWTGPESYDYSQLDSRIRMVLDAVPEAYLFPRLYLSAPDWWLQQHPEAVVTFDPGDGVPQPFRQSGRLVPSWSSAAWREAASDALRRLIRHIDSQPYADRVIGYHIVSGTTEEWMMWGANDDQWTDYSPANQAGFRAWLTARYASDAALQAAWGRPDVSLATAAIPPRTVRAASAAGVLRDPVVDGPSIDYVRYIADLTAETIDLFCGVVKEETGGRRLAGTFYGYLLQLFGQRQQNAAHLALDSVLRSPRVDFIASPTSYAFRAVHGGTSHFMAPLGSVLAHGKVWFDENDIRTSLAPGEIGSWGKPETIEGDFQQQDRELANVLANGAAQWWFDVGRNRYDDPRLMARLARLTEVATVASAVDRSPIDQVALVVDGRGLANINVGDPLMAPILLHQLPPLARLGAPAGHYELGDISPLRRCRLIIFAGLYEPTAAQRAAIVSLQSEGRVLVFIHAAGPYQAGRWLPEASAELAGMTLRLVDGPLPPLATFTGDDPLVAGLTGGYGIDRPTRPLFVPADPAATVLATLPDGSPGLAVRRHADWTAVFSAAPALPAPLLARLAEAAGVHRYVDTPDVVWGSRELLALVADTAGPRTVRLPARSRVTDLYAGRLVGDDLESFTVELAAGETRLWQVTAAR